MQLTERERLWTVAAGAALAGMLFGCCAGAGAGFLWPRARPGDAEPPEEVHIFNTPMEAHDHMTKQVLRKKPVTR